MTNQIKTKKETIVEYYKQNGISDEMIKEHILFDTGHMLFQSKNEKYDFSGTWFEDVKIDNLNYDIICRKENDYSTPAPHEKFEFYYFLPSELKKILEEKPLTNRELINQQIKIKCDKIRKLEDEIVDLQIKEKFMCDSDGYYEEKEEDRYFNNKKEGKYLVGRRYFFEQFMDADTGKHTEVEMSEVIKRERI